MKIKSTLIIATYNWPEALGLVLLSLKNQKVFPNEIIVADDGSTAQTKLLVEHFRDDLTIPIIHVWHKDNGFRKSEILNKAIAKAKGEYIIQVDGDCIMHPKFIYDHLTFAKKKTYLFGSRANIKESYLDDLFIKNQVRFNVFSKGIKKRTRTLYLPFLSRFYGETDTLSKKYRGCNTSYFKSDFIAINGYNEDFIGWGREDSEMALRFHNYGLKGRRIRYRGIVYHVFHNEKPKDRVRINDEIEKQTSANKSDWCTNGIDKYLSEKK